MSEISVFDDIDLIKDKIGGTYAEMLKAKIRSQLSAQEKEVERLRAALEKIAKHEGMCMMGPDSETRDEMIAFSNGDYETLVHKVFELGSHRAYGECARLAKEALTPDPPKRGEGE